MLYALTSAYSRKDYDNHQQGRPLETNIGKLFSLFAWGLDIVQENAELVKQWDDLEAARGAVLDRYGANWGVQRFSESDALYRLAIRVKILSQLSGGDTDTVIRAAADLLGVENHDVEFEDVFPAKIALYVDWLLLTQERQDLIEPIAWAIKRIVAAGVNALKTNDNATIVITHYQRLLDYIKPDFVHILYKGQIVHSGGPELALELEEKGYDWIKQQHQS